MDDINILNEKLMNMEYQYRKLENKLELASDKLSDLDYYNCDDCYNWFNHKDIQFCDRCSKRYCNNCQESNIISIYNEEFRNHDDVCKDCAKY